MDASALELTQEVEEKADSRTLFNVLGYRPELDGFRGISIILVFIHHVFHSILPGGFLGVDMFFVLSGFLITSLLLQEWHFDRKISLKNFYIRRLFRLMPAVFFISLLLFGYAFAFLDESAASNTFKGIWLTLSYNSNWFYAFNFASANNPLGVTWSLAIEEQFYLVFPVLLYFALRYKFSNRQIVSILIVSIILIAVHRKILADQGASTQLLYYSSDTRADALLIGCVTAFVYSYNLLPFKKIEGYLKIFAVISLIFLIFMNATADASDTILYNQALYSFVALAVSALLIILLVYKARFAVKALSFAPLVWIGRVSYGLYLWHWTIRYFVYGNKILPESYAQLAFVIFASFFFTILSYYCIEKPFLKLKNRFGKAQTPVPV